MNIRKVEINNFRGIKYCSWSIPDDRRFVCLVGPGDSGKSTIIDAIHLALSDRWRLSIADTDFYNCDTAQSICIRVVVANLPKEILKDSAFGLALSGIDADGTLYQDPEDSLESCIIVQLLIDSSHEPVWTVERLDGSISSEIRSSHRHYLSTFKVDERADVHLRWTSTSALGRLSSDRNSAAKAMASAARAASKAIAEYEDSALSELTSNVQAKINEAGGGSFSSIHPGLDTSLSSTSGNLALYESDVPLTNYGLGTRRISGLAVQQIAAANKALLLIDEVETGLEPHRLVRLIHYLKDDDAYSQIFMTTHSPVAVEQSSTDNLAIVRANNGSASVSFLPNSKKALGLRRQRPSSFLANRVLVVEGKTEEGMLLHFIEKWDKERIVAGQPVAAGEGSIVQDGQGGAEAVVRALFMHGLGYETAVLIDNDDRSVDKHATAASTEHVPVIRWELNNNLESQIVKSCEVVELSSLLTLAKEIRGGEQVVLLDLSSAGLPESCTTLMVQDWIDSGVELESVKSIIATAASEKAWFKLVDSGRELGAWIDENAHSFIDSVVPDTINIARDFLYPTLTEADKDAGTTE
ncbi:MAG TPA: AAA family ATPase [Candidatus Saccharibacteria bacterium]|nr:AAA family ATPase [Candidatus Saccharibacteria bacterium]